MVVGWYHLGQGDSTDSKACEGVRCVRILLGKHMQVWPWQLELRQTSRSCFETTEDSLSLSLSVCLAQFPRNFLSSALLTSQKWSTSSSSTSWQICKKHPKISKPTKEEPGCETEAISLAPDRIGGVSWREFLEWRWRPRWRYHDNAYGTDDADEEQLTHHDNNHRESWWLGWRRRSRWWWWYWWW